MIKRRRVPPQLAADHLTILDLIHHMIRVTDPNRVKPKPENVHETFDPGHYPKAAQPLADFLRRRRS